MHLAVDCSVLSKATLGSVNEKGKKGPSSFQILKLVEALRTAVSVAARFNHVEVAQKFKTGYVS